MEQKEKLKKITLEPKANGMLVGVIRGDSVWTDEAEETFFHSVSQTLKFVLDELDSTLATEDGIDLAIDLAIELLMHHSRKANAPQPPKQFIISALKELTDEEKKELFSVETEEEL